MVDCTLSLLLLYSPALCADTPRIIQLARNTYPEGLGEPINIVISADSDALLMTDTGFFDWGFSIDFSGECLGQSDGAKQAANLGDGLGFSKFFPSKFSLFPPFDH